MERLPFWRATPLCELRRGSGRCEPDNLRSLRAQGYLSWVTGDLRYSLSEAALALRWHLSRRRRVLVVRATLRQHAPVRRGLGGSAIVERNRAMLRRGSRGDKLRYSAYEVGGKNAALGKI
jgi:hypothetical protein